MSVEPNRGQPGQGGEAVIERATPADHQEIARIVLSSYRAAVGDTLDSGYAAYLERVEERADVATLLVARAGGKVVGTVTFVPDSRAPDMEP